MREADGGNLWYRRRKFGQAWGRKGNLEISRTGRKDLVADPYVMADWRRVEEGVLCSPATSFLGFGEVRSWLAGYPSCIQFWRLTSVLPRYLVGRLPRYRP